MSDAHEPESEQLELPLRRRRRRGVGGMRWLPSGKATRQPGDHTAQVRVRGRCRDGTAFELADSVAPDHAEEALARFRVLADEYKRGVRKPEETITLAQWQPRYARRAPWGQSHESAFKILKPLHATSLQRIDEGAITAWARKVAVKPGQKVKRGSGKASPGYLRTCYDVLSAMVREAVNARVIAEMPWRSRPQGVPSGDAVRQAGKRPPLEPYQVAALIEAAWELDSGLNLRLLFALQTGVRPHAECAVAMRDWLKPADSPHAPEGAGVMQWPAVKGGKAHSSPLHPALYARLVDHWEDLPDGARRTGYLFPILRRTRWVARAEFVNQREWKKLRTMTGIDAVLYQLRHTRLSDIANDATLGTWAAATLAGHRDERTTRGYITADKTLKANAWEPTATLAAAGLHRLDGGPDEPPPTGTDPGRGGAEGAEVIRLHAPKPQESTRGCTRNDRAQHMNRRPGSADGEPSDSEGLQGATARAQQSHPQSERPVPPPEAYGLCPENAAPGLPAEDPSFLELHELAVRVQATGAEGAARALWAHLGADDPADACAYASEIMEALREQGAALEPSLQRGLRQCAARLRALASGPKKSKSSAAMVAAEKTEGNQELRAEMAVGGTCYTSPSAPDGHGP